jgi:hypothetical protein
VAPASISSVLYGFLTKRKLTLQSHWVSIGHRAGLGRQAIERLVEPKGEDPHPTRGRLVKVAEALRLDADERAELERVSGHSDHPGFLRETRAKLLDGPQATSEDVPVTAPRKPISMRRAVLLITAPEDPSKKLGRKATTPPWNEVAFRSGVVFGAHDYVLRATTPEGVSVLDYSQWLFEKGRLRTVETVPLRDDMPIYLDREFSNAHLFDNDYVWATIFIQALGGVRKPEFPKIFYEVSEDQRFWGGVHLLTAAITVGQYDSVVEILASNLDVLQNYVRDAQRFALDEHQREAHTVTYFATHLKSNLPDAGEF